MKQHLLLFTFGIVCVISWTLVLQRIQNSFDAVTRREEEYRNKIAQFELKCGHEKRILMENSEESKLKNLKIFVYPLPGKFNKDELALNEAHPPPIYDPNCMKNFYSAEYSFHQFLLSSPYVTLNGEEADLFYIPIYGVCYLLNHHPNNLTKTSQFIGEGLTVVKNEYPYWNRSNGRDHVMAFTQGFGPQLFNWTETKSSIFLVANGQFTLPEFTPHKDIPIPPDLSHYFEPLWVLPNRTLYEKKKYFAFFGGTVLPANLTDHRGSFYSKGVRQFITEYYKDHPDFRITGTRSKTYHEDVKSSTFCICPEGWHAWNPRPYEAVQLGCIPVLLTEQLELAFEEVIDYSKFLIRISPTKVKYLLEILKSISESEILQRQREMEKVWKYFSYHSMGQAPQTIVRLLSSRVPQQKIRRHYLDERDIKKLKS